MKIFTLGKETCPICGGQVGHIRLESGNSVSRYYGCPRCEETLYVLEVKKTCNDLDSEIQTGTEIRAYEPPTPSGYGEVKRIFRKTEKGWEYEGYVDGEKRYSETADSLYELLSTWYNPWPAVEVIAKWLYHRKTGKKGVSETEVLFGKSIMQPVYDDC